MHDDDWLEQFERDCEQVKQGLTDERLLARTTSNVRVDLVDALLNGVRHLAREIDELKGRHETPVRPDPSGQLPEELKHRIEDLIRYNRVSTQPRLGPSERVPGRKRTFTDQELDALLERYAKSFENAVLKDKLTALLARPLLCFSERQRERIRREISRL